MMLLTVLAQPWQIMTMMTTEVDCFVNSEDNNDSGEDTDGSEDLKTALFTRLKEKIFQRDLLRKAARVENS